MRTLPGCLSDTRVVPLQSPRVDQTSEHFGIHHQHYPRGSNSPTTTTHSAHNRSHPNSRSASNIRVFASCQPSFPGSVCPIQTVDEAKTPFSSRLLRQMEFWTSLPQFLHAVFMSGPGAVHLQWGKNLLDPRLLQGWTCCEVVLSQKVTTK